MGVRGGQEGRWCGVMEDKRKWELEGVKEGRWCGVMEDKGKWELEGSRKGDGVE